MTRRVRHKSRSHIAAAAAVTLAALAVVLSAPTPARAQDGGTESVFKLGAGSRGIALGRAFTPMADDASAMYWNPAALRNVQDKQLTFMYLPLFGDFADASYTFFGATFPTVGAGAIGLGFMRVSSSFEGYDQLSVPTGEQDYSETQLLIGYAFERHIPLISGALSTGLNFKIANQNVGGPSSTAPGVDLGFQYRPEFAQRFQVALHFQDLVGPEHKLNINPDDAYQTVMMGVGYTHPFSRGSALRVMMQLNAPEKADNSVHLGAEYAFANYVQLRAGIDDGDVTFGLGVDVRAFGFDYAMFNRETAGTSQPVTFTMHYGNTLGEQREILARREAERQQEAIQAEYNSRVQSHRDLAVDAEANGVIPTAMDEWKIVLEFVPGDSQAVRHLDDLTQQQLEAQARANRDIEKQATIDAHFAQALQAYQQNDYVRSRAEWRAVLAVDSTHAEAQDYLQRTQQKIDESLGDHIARARQLESGGRLTEAVGEWSNVQALDPGNEQAAVAIARIRRTIESQSQSLAETQRRLKVVDLYNSALQEFNQGNYEDAMTKVDQVLALEPGHQDAQSLKVMAHRKLTPLTKEEEAEIRRLYLRGMEFYAKDEYAEAISEWEKILKIDPTNERVKTNIEEAKERQKQLGQN